MRLHRYAMQYPLDDFLLDFFGEEVHKFHKFPENDDLSEEGSILDRLSYLNSTPRKDYFCMSLRFNTDATSLFAMYPDMIKKLKPETSFRYSNARKFYDGVERKITFMKPEDDIYYPVEIDVYSRDLDSGMDMLADLVLSRYKNDVRDEIPDKSHEIIRIDNIIENFDIDELRQHMLL